MTLDEAIKHAEEVMSEKSYEFQESVALQEHENAKLCRECAEEHRQLAEWLKDYKRLLEQEPILDKIRAEIERERSFQRAIDEYDVATGLRKALEILDKYKAESEDKE